MPKTDNILWYILAVTGLTFGNYRLGAIAKCLRIIFIAGFGIIRLYFAVNIMCGIGSESYKISLSSIMFLFYTALMWYFAYSKRKSISNVISEVYRRSKRYNNSKAPLKHVLVLLTLTILICPFFLCLVIGIIENLETVDVSGWLLGYNIQDKIWKRIILLSAFLAIFIFDSGFSYFLTISICVIFYRCSKLISSYNRSLQNELRTKFIINIAHFSEFFQFVKILRDLNKTFQHLSFLIIIYNMQKLFIVLLHSTQGDIYNASLFGILLLLYSGICSIIMIVALTICSSLIPESLIEIKTVVRDYINDPNYTYTISKRNLFYLNRLECEDIVHISACGMFQLTRGFILSALGLMITYGLLFINIKI